MQLQPHFLFNVLNTENLVGRVGNALGEVRWTAWCKMCVSL